MSRLFSFYVGLDHCINEKEQMVNSTVIELSVWYGGATAFQGRGGWKDSKRIYLEDSCRFDILEGDKPVDASFIAAWLGRQYGQQEVLITIATVESFSITIKPENL